MGHPTNLTELLNYLAEKPHVQMDGNTRTFCDFRNGGLYFLSTENNGPAFVPIHCGGKNNPSVLSFCEEGFAVERFGKKFFYKYKE